tara:strand:- start:16159 stop:16308 length:150 start_codon:yes stop_codon:yes gene_type:complete
MRDSPLTINPEGSIAVIDIYHPIDFFIVLRRNSDLTYSTKLNLPTYFNP